jgi:hypothetical protein
MDGTIDEIVKASSLPLSIVIVGVGSADFQNMETLDADDAPLRSSNGQYAKRDIVQVRTILFTSKIHRSLFQCKSTRIALQH